MKGHTRDGEKGRGCNEHHKHSGGKGKGIFCVRASSLFRKYASI